MKCKKIAVLSICQQSNAGRAGSRQLDLGSLLVLAAPGAELTGRRRQENAE